MSTTSLRSMEFLIRSCTAAAIIALLCVFVVVGLSIANQSLRQQVGERQKVINQGLTLSQVNTRLVNSLATLAVKNDDEQIKKLLADHGITVRADQTTPQSPSENQTTPQPPAEK